MIKKIVFIIILLYFFELSSFSEIAILPYKVNNPSEYFKAETGSEYSKLISLGAVYKKDLDVAAPRDIEMDLRRFGLDPEKTLTGEDLDMIGRARFLDYILLGTLSKSGRKYLSSSVLYSVKEKKAVINMKFSGNSLIELAQKEVREIFYNFKDIKKSMDKPPLDLVFLIDTSYKMSLEWTSVKDAILRLSGYIIDSLRIDTRIYIIPFSSKTSYDYGSVSLNSITSLRKILDVIQPSGGMNSGNFFNSLKHSVENVKWRRDATKLIMVIANSNIGRTGYNEKYGIISEQKGIKINSISLSSFKADEHEIIKRLSSNTKGNYREVSYHQKVFDVNGSMIELYLEGNRVFQSRVYDISWMDGIIDNKNQYTGFGKPKSYLNEIFYDEKKYIIEPGKIAEEFSNITGERIINKEKLENNLHEVLNSIFSGFYNVKGTSYSPVGKALISDGKISFWIQIYDSGLYNFLNDKYRQGYVMPLGVMIKEDQANAYGISLLPMSYKITSDFVPSLLKAELTDIVKRKKYFMENGLFHPPLWFIDVKIENIELFSRARDIRE